MKYSGDFLSYGGGDMCEKGSWIDTGGKRYAWDRG